MSNVCEKLLQEVVRRLQPGDNADDLLGKVERVAATLTNLSERFSKQPVIVLNMGEGSPQVTIHNHFGENVHTTIERSDARLETTTVSPAATTSAPPTETSNVTPNLASPGLPEVPRESEQPAVEQSVTPPVVVSNLKPIKTTKVASTKTVNVTASKSEEHSTMELTMPIDEQTATRELSIVSKKDVATKTSIKAPTETELASSGSGSLESMPSTVASTSPAVTTKTGTTTSTKSSVPSTSKSISKSSELSIVSKKNVASKTSIKAPTEAELASSGAGSLESMPSAVASTSPAVTTKTVPTTSKKLSVPSTSKSISKSPELSIVSKKNVASKTSIKAPTEAELTSSGAGSLESMPSAVASTSPAVTTKTGSTTLKKLSIPSTSKSISKSSELSIVPPKEVASTTSIKAPTETELASSGAGSLESMPSAVASTSPAVTTKTVPTTSKKLSVPSTSKSISKSPGESKDNDYDRTNVVTITRHEDEKPIRETLNRFVTNKKGKVVRDPSTGYPTLDASYLKTMCFDYECGQETDFICQAKDLLIENVYATPLFWIGCEYCCVGEHSRIGWYHCICADFGNVDPSELKKYKCQRCKDEKRTTKSKFISENDDASSQGNKRTPQPTRKAEIPPKKRKIAARAESEESQGSIEMQKLPVKATFIKGKMFNPRGHELYRPYSEPENSGNTLQILRIMNENKNQIEKWRMEYPAIEQIAQMLEQGRFDNYFRAHKDIAAKMWQAYLKNKDVEDWMRLALEDIFEIVTQREAERQRKNMLNEKKNKGAQSKHVEMDSDEKEVEEEEDEEEEDGNEQPITSLETKPNPKDRTRIWIKVNSERLKALLDKWVKKTGKNKMNTVLYVKGEWLLVTQDNRDEFEDYLIRKTRKKNDKKQ